MNDITKTTTDLNEIMDWVKKHDGTPETVVDPNAPSDPVKLRFDFPGNDDDKYLSEFVVRKKISWDQFKEMLDRQNLAVEYDDREKTLDPSSDYRFLKRENIDVND